MSLDTGAITMADDKVHWAFVVGGQPSQNKQVQLKLYKLGINIAGYADADKRVLDNLPKITTLVVILIDQVPHPLRDKAKELAEKQDLPVVAGMFRNWSEIETRIKSRNFSGPSIEPPVGQFPVKKFDTKLGDVLGDKLKPVTETVSPPTPTTATPAPAANLVKNMRKVPQASRDRAAIAEKILIENRGYILNEQIQTLVVSAVGHRLSMEVIRKLRKKLGFNTPPRGSGGPAWVRKCRLEHKLPPLDVETGTRNKSRKVQEKKEPISRPTEKKEQPTQKEETTRIGQEFDEIFLPVTRPKLEEWQLKHHVGKLYIAWENGEWQVNWEFIKIESGGRTYSRKDKK